MSSDAATARVTWRDRLSRFEYKASPYLYISPFFIVFSVTGLFPLVYTAWVSVHKWHLIGGDKGFNGVENYAAVLDAAQYILNFLTVLSSADHRRDIHCLGARCQLACQDILAHGCAAALRCGACGRGPDLLESFR